MKHHKIHVRILPMVNDINSKSTFWVYLCKLINKEVADPEILEKMFKSNFSKSLKDNLKKKLNFELNQIEEIYNIEFYLKRYPERYVKNDEGGKSTDFLSDIVKLQELKNSYFKENEEYQKLLKKRILASQIDFGIENIYYSSLGFDLIIEPFDKAAELFDNNYELLRTFFDQYVPESFLSSLAMPSNLSIIPISINYPNEFKIDFENINKVKGYSNMDYSNSNFNQNKWDKARWAWTITNTSLVLPVILALFLLYFIYNKLEFIEKNRQEYYDDINLERDKLLNEYQKMIEFQRESYQELIFEIQANNRK